MDHKSAGRGIRGVLAGIVCFPLVLAGKTRVLVDVDLANLCTCSTPLVIVTHLGTISKFNTSVHCYIR